ncbi:MAG TPA: class I lanthipeptide [Polyangia bacterium]|nr:class I lanthipeptide [Polyangia bacterium]
MRNPSKKLINAKKLSLSKETLRHLCDQELADVAGGAKTDRCTGAGSPTATCTSGPSWPCTH